MCIRDRAVHLPLVVGALDNVAGGGHGTDDSMLLARVNVLSTLAFMAVDVFPGLVELHISPVEVLVLIHLWLDDLPKLQERIGR